MLRLARSGWCGGNPKIIEELPADMVLDMLSYDDFKSDYEDEYYNLNKDNESR